MKREQRAVPAGRRQRDWWWLVLAGVIVLALAAFVAGRWSARQAPYRAFPAVDRSGNLPADLDYQSIEQVYDLLRDNYDGPLDASELITGLKKGLVAAAGDPYTEYLDAEQRAVLETFLSSGFEGVGIEIIQRGGELIVVAPIEGSPAFRAGLKPQDVILEIDGQSVSQLTITDAVRLIKGPSGTVVNLKIRRDGVELDQIPITRDFINYPSVVWRVEDSVGIVRINRFNDQTVNLMAEAAADFLAQPPRGIVLDLRSNPGGDLDQSLSIAGFWLDPGQVVIEQRVRGQPVEPKLVGPAPALAADQPVFADWPTVVLLDGGSASASEIVAGALRDHGRATIVGQRSFGKGSVQALIEVVDQRAVEILKVTTSHWHTPLGYEIDLIGLPPDVEVVNPEPEPGQEAVDRQLERAKQLIIDGDV